MNTQIRKDWFGLVKVLEVKHLSADGQLLWEASNLYNMLHEQGEKFMLTALFDTAGGISVPVNYYIGLDSRATIASSDTLTTVSVSEPLGTTGYARASVSSAGLFTITQLQTGIYQAKSPIVSFTSTSTWSAKNMFLTNVSGSSGYLIASVYLGSTITVTPGEIVSMRLGLSLKDC